MKVGDTSNNDSSSSGGGCPYAKFSTTTDGAVFDGSTSKKSLLSGTFGSSHGSNNEKDGGDSANVEVTQTSGRTKSHVEDVKKALELAKTQCPAFNALATNGGGVSCPFRNSYSTQQFQDTMKLVPASHFAGVGSGGGSVTSHSSEENDDDHTAFAARNKANERIATPFRIALEHVHAVSQILHNSSAPQENSKSESTESRADVSSDFMLDGGCPFKQLYHDRTKSNSTAKEVFVPFVHAMEEYSISAQMIRMLKDEHLPPSKRSASTRNLAGMTRVDSMDALTSFFEQSDEKKLQDSTTKTVAKDEVEEESPAKNDISPKLEQDQSIEEEHSTDNANDGKLSKALKTGTTASHKAAENVHFVRNFVKGKIDLDLFVQLTEDLYHVYDTLEARLDEEIKTSNVAWKPLHRPHQLARTDALQRDLMFFLGKKTDFTTLTPTPATQDYLDRINYVAQTDPLLLLSHSYTRYLGDLSGGRVLQRVAQKALQLPKADDGKAQGLQFYEFPNIPEGAKKFKDWYRHTLDGLELSALEIAKLVGEANVAFLLNMRVFEELDVKAGVEGAKVRPLSDALRYYDEAVQAFQDEGLDKATNSTASSAQCPFASKKNPSTKDQEGLAKKCPASNGIMVPVPGQTCPISKKTVAARSDAKCPMSTGKGSTNALISENTATPSKRCPWPFIFFHDPVQGLRDYQTWVVLCLLCCYIYKVIILPQLLHHP